MRLLGFQTPIPQGYVRMLGNMMPLNLNFLQEDTFDPRITFTRSSGGGRFNSSGEFEWLGTDEPRIDYDPVTGECLGLLIEEQRTNGFRYSTDLSSALSSPVVVGLSTIKQTGLFVGDEVLFSRTTTTTNSYYGRAVSYPVGTAITGYVIAKAGAGGRLGLRFQGMYPNRADAVFDLAAGTVVGTASSTYTNTAAGIVPLGSGIYLCWLTTTPTTTNVSAMYFGPTDSTRTLGSWEAPVSAANSVTLYFAQNETGSFYTSPIITAGSAVTRAADNAYVELGSVLAGVSKPTFYLEMIPKDALGTQLFLDTRDTGFENGFSILRAGSDPEGNLYYISRAGDVGSSAVWTGHVYEAGDLVKMAACHDGSKARVSVNGSSAVGTTKNYAQGPSRIYLFSNASLTSKASGHARRLRYFRHPLSDRNLQWLTTP